MSKPTKPSTAHRSKEPKLYRVFFNTRMLGYPPSQLFWADSQAEARVAARDAHPDWVIETIEEERKR